MIVFILKLITYEIFPNKLFKSLRYLIKLPQKLNEKLFK